MIRVRNLSLLGSFILGDKMKKKFRHLFLKNFFFRKYNKKSGYSIVELLIVVGLMSIIMMFFAQMQFNQLKENHSLGEVLASMDTQKILIAALADGTVCQSLLKNNPANVFDVNAVATANPPQVPYPSIDLGSGPTNSDPTAGTLYASVISSGPPAVYGPIVAQVGSSPSVFSSSLVVSRIRLVISGMPPLPIPNSPGQKFTGSWVVDFDSSKTIRPVKSLSIGTMLTVDTTNPDAAKITGCMGNTYGTCPNGQMMIGNNIDGSPKCTTNPSVNGSVVGSVCNIGTHIGIVIMKNGGRCCVVDNFTSPTANTSSMNCVDF